MAVTFDSASAGSNGGNDTGASQAFTNTAGTKLYAWVSTDSAVTSPSATWDSVAMTLEASQADDTPNMYLFSLTEPATGAKTLAFSWTGASQSDFGFISLTGAGATGTISKANVAADTTNFGPTVTLAADELMLAAGGYADGTDEIAVVTGTQRAESGTGTTSGHSINLATNSGTGSTSIAWSRASSFKAVYVGIQVSEPVSVTVEPAVVTATANVLDPAISAGASVSPAVVELTANVVDPTVTAPTPKWDNTDKTSAATATNTAKNAVSISNISKNAASPTNVAKTP